MSDKGGETSYKNMQLACFSCNSYKGERTMGGGDQLLLFGDPTFKREEAHGQGALTLASFETV